ncbi:ADP-ribosylglycohydrolase family protein [Marinilongibacter aquaticus]|uniref:ADP-ribosylglycohydrolase family protein n=1 Tax=Marinilongibacter aquaticus TaxID=2975157 RepID=UPI0021BD0903|nr:ADP-ribosylglycohydrolase family protein [Marinilongibacter aquaticus]UBM57480.1 ADP-ribosylglycohydrolase family protein [Marinilongibacter aquaticus]
MRKLFILLLISTGFSSAQTKEFGNQIVGETGLTEAQLYDKILGSLVGSAIGDAMGAPTEMWSREAIAFDFGFVDRLDSMVREPSPEGTWKMNLPAGGTTDDTRWKALTYSFLAQQQSQNLKAKDWAKAILKKYEQAIEAYKTIDSLEPEPFEENALHVAWLQEWAKVARAYLSGDVDKFAKAQSKFYGGEMVCAGLLYSPALGVFFPGNPEQAYARAFDLSIFDIGYARDLTGLTAALTAQAMRPNLETDAFWAVLRNTDPQAYFNSRLVGRTSFRIFRLARQINAEAQKSENPLQKAFELLDQHQQDMPFHAGEIYLQTITAMLCSDLDFQKTMEFLVNYGRDNDTTAALAGGILGAYWGYDRLPKQARTQVVRVANTLLDLDLEDLAKALTRKVIQLEKAAKN